MVILTKYSFRLFEKIISNETKIKSDIIFHKNKNCKNLLNDFFNPIIPEYFLGNNEYEEWFGINKFFLKNSLQSFNKIHFEKWQVNYEEEYSAKNSGTIILEKNEVELMDLGLKKCISCYGLEDRPEYNIVSSTDL